MQVPLQGLWAVGYCWNVNWNVLVVFWLSCSWILLSVCSVGFSMGVFERINTGVVGLERGSSTASKEPGNDHASGEFVVGKGFLSMQILENVALIWNVFFSESKRTTPSTGRVLGF